MSLHDRSQGNARAPKVMREHTLPLYSGNQDHPDQRGRWPAFRAASSRRALERVMYRPWYVGIAADNTGYGVLPTLDAARAAVADRKAASAGGRLAEGLLGADVDASDPLIGDAVAETLIRWCGQHDLPYLLRDSGRSGGRHIVAVVTHADVPCSEWAQLCRRLARQYRVVVDDRTGKVLRLLTAPHRLGLPSPIITCTITPAAVMDAYTRHARKAAAKAGRARRRAARSGGTVDGSRSAREYGHACALARHGGSAEHAWAELRAAEGKAAKLGRPWFARYVWMPAVTTVAAEQGLAEDTAWQLACMADPTLASRGRDTWRWRWSRATAEAGTDRPRRYRLPEDHTAEATLTPETAAELDAHRAGLYAAVDAIPGLDPRRRHSVQAVVYALAHPLVTRDGSISTRTLAEQALLARSTTLNALRTAVSYGVLVRPHRYGGGASDCDAYRLGPAAIDLVCAARKISQTTRCTTPRATGSASLLRLQTAHARARRTWRLRCDALASLAPGERLATSRHPAAKTLRSLWFQRRWWTQLTSEQQEQRRAHRRELLAGMHRSERSAWISWLSERNDIADAAARITAASPEPGDAEAVLDAPRTLHRGLAAPDWRTRHQWRTEQAPTATAA
ncbi:hypothetical protein [Nocardia brasiliensis]|uniref:hypothetical protein n=1 Tax=Nocardia brasiliensis TaxID=37326 RepID=UPI00189328A8|nr:hypothetical protein [Nocardia brasiliensis]MBF6548873.1 hypothetical protein [Nocardia brasiliensis]